MAKRAGSYKSEKRRKELSRLKKQEEKRQKRLTKVMSEEQVTEKTDTAESDTSGSA